jgi:hypothetical protein
MPVEACLTDLAKNKSEHRGKSLVNAFAGRPRDGVAESVSSAVGVVGLTFPYRRSRFRTRRPLHFIRLTCGRRRCLLRPNANAACKCSRCVLLVSLFQLGRQCRKKLLIQLNACVLHCSAAQKICMLLAYIPMVLVLMLIFTDVYILNYIWAPFKYTDTPVFTTCVTVVFDILVVLLLTSYLRCIFTSSAQRHYTPPAEWDESDPYASVCLSPFHIRVAFARKRSDANGQSLKALIRALRFSAYTRLLANRF